jgi:hypothetical protein
VATKTNHGPVGTASTILTVYKVDVLCISYTSFETILQLCVYWDKAYWAPRFKHMVSQSLYLAVSPQHLTLASSLGHFVGKERHSNIAQPLILSTVASQYLAFSS